MDHGNRLLICDLYLVDVGHLHAEIRKLLNSGHFKLKNLFKVPGHRLECQLDGEEKSHSVVFLELDVVVSQYSLVSEVAFRNQDAEVFEVAFGASVLPSSVAEADNEELPAHQHVLLEKLKPGLIVAVGFDKGVD